LSDEEPRDEASGVVWRTAIGSEPLPAPRVEGTVPISGWDAAGDVDIVRRPNGNLSMVVRDASLSRVLSLVAQTYSLNIVASNDIDAVISITLQDVPMEQALSAILAVANYTWVQRNGIIMITSLSDSTQLPADIQGRQMQVFELDFVSAGVVADAVTQLISPVGRIAVSASSDSDNRRTSETILVEDVPQSLARVAAYIHQIDQAPQQVLLEAHILQVTLNDDTSNGVNFNALFRIAGSRVNVLSVPSVSAGLSAPSNIDTPTSLITIDGSDLDAVVELLKTTTDAKTLGSPKLLVLDEQEARIQIGQRFAYATTTTTQTSATGGASFVETGTILRIRPRITRDGRVLLNVAPEVSEAGERPANSELPPDMSTTELETDVMLEDGQGMVIGGLIKESDTTGQSKVPYLGDVRGIGWFFRHSKVTKVRQEIIVAIVPRIQPYDSQWHAYEQGELARTQTPLFAGPLCRTERPWEATLPDGKRVAKPIIPPPRTRPYIDRTCDCVTPTPGYYVPRRPFPRQRYDDGYDAQVPEFPSSLRRPQPQLSDEFVDELSDDFAYESTVISDQP
jgi:type II secretory pathway component GspD/PulD (secretin)